MENIRNEIIKASVKNDRCEVSYREDFTESNYSNEVQKKCAQIVHADLKDAFRNLKKHLVVICEQPEANLINQENILSFDPEELPNYIVTGYTISGTDESRGVVIIAQKLLKSGQVLNLISPFVKFEDYEVYRFSGELLTDIEMCNWEVSEYLFSEKWGIKQLEFDFEMVENTENSAVITVSDKKGRGRKKKETVEEVYNED